MLSTVSMTFLKLCIVIPGNESNISCAVSLELYSESSVEEDVEVPAAIA